MSEWMKNPLEWEDYVYKEVRVLASEKKQYKGWLLTTDPVSANPKLHPPPFFLFSFFFFFLGGGGQASCILNTHFATELHPPTQLML
uniref:Gem-associated protein 6 Sm-like domain-containing protein n=1 Tax=Sciurus vulgaris TaxID=55149 RepID=A0A8D2JNM1_SCIVU